MALSKHHHTLTVITTVPYPIEAVEVLVPPAQEFSAVLAPPAQEFGDQLLTQHSIQQFKQKILFCTIFHKQSLFLLKKKKKSHNLTIPKSYKTIKLHLPNPPFDNNTPIKNPNHYHVEASMGKDLRTKFVFQE